MLASTSDANFSQRPEDAGHGPHRRNLYEKKNAVYYFQISLFVPDIFKFLKYA